jgi:hypothetical protein
MLKRQAPLNAENLSLQPSRQGWMPRWAKRKHLCLCFPVLTKLCLGIKMSLSGVASNAASWLPSAFVRSVPAELWVKYGNAQTVEVSTARRNNVDDFKRAIKKKLMLTISPGEFDVYVEGKPGNPLDPMMLLRDAVAKHGIRSDTVLIVKTIPAVTVAHGKYLNSV